MQTLAAIHWVWYILVTTIFVSLDVKQKFHFTSSVLVKVDKMLYLILCHGFGDECDVYFFAFLEHSFRAGGSARVNIDLNITVFFENLVHGDHEATEEERWVIQVDKDESVGLFLLDRSSD